MSPQSAPSQPSASTRDGLLLAAEKLFAANGIGGASLRAITHEAGANLASVNYHFGSKEGLVREMFRRRLEPLHRERRALLDACPEDDLRGIIEAFVSPVLKMVQDERLHAFACLVGRSFSQPDTGVRNLLLEEFRPTMERFVERLALALPDLPRDEVFWRFHFMVGCMAHTAATGPLIEWISGGRCTTNEVDRNIRRLVDFLLAGMSTPAPPPGGSP